MASESTVNNGNSALSCNISTRQLISQRPLDPIRKMRCRAVWGIPDHWPDPQQKSSHCVDCCPVKGKWHPRLTELEFYNLCPLPSVAGGQNDVRIKGPCQPLNSTWKWSPTPSSSANRDNYFYIAYTFVKNTLGTFFAVTEKCGFWKLLTST